MVIGLASVSLALFLAILPISLSVSAVGQDDSTYNTVISLPFPSPDSFGDSSRAIVMYNSVKNRYSMFVLTFNISPYVSSSDSIEFYATLNCGNNDNKATFNYVTFRASFVPPMIDWDSSPGTDINRIAECRLYRFNWNVGSTNYSVSKVNLSGTHSPSLAYNPATGDAYNLSYIYGDNSLPYEWSTKYTACYHGAWTNVVSNSNISYSFTTSDSGAILSCLNNFSGTVRFYLGEILSKLTSDEGYTPEQTTTNSDMSDYDNAEGALMDNNIQALNDMALPDIDNFNSGKQGNAFQFISSNIEFFGGMNGSGSIAKVGTVLMVILALGLTSFVIGLSNRKKGG